MSQFRYLLVIIVPVLTFMVGWASGQQVQLAKPLAPTNAETTESTLLDKWFGQKQRSINPEDIEMDIFWTVWDEINKGYVDAGSVKEENMVYGAIEGLTESLEDPYSYFLPPTESKDFNDSLNGDLQGIGAEVSKRDGKVIVVSPLKDSPAERAGILPGDEILLIDDTVAAELGLYEAVDLIRGVPGSEVRLTILREGEEESREFTIKREKINVPSVTYEWKEQDIVHVEVNQFGGKTIEEFQKMVAEFGIRKPSGIILDLRYNGGGYLDGAVDLLSFFIKEGKAVTVKMRNPKDTETQRVSGKAPLATVPLVVLINKGSASASEIVAGAVQDHKRGALIGETTFGKGSVQELLPLKDGSSLRLTIAKWYTPNDRDIDMEGVVPDIEVPLTVEDAQAGRDPQLDRAIEFLVNKESL